MNKLKLFWALLIFVSVWSKAIAQENPEIAKYKTKHEEHAAIILLEEKVLNFTIKADTLHIVSEEKEEVLFLKNQAEFLARNSIHGSHFREPYDMDAHTLVWVDKKYKKSPVKDFKKKSSTSDGIFFDDSYEYTFTYPSIQAGNKAVLNYKVLHKDPRFISGFIFSHYLPVEKTQFRIRLPKEVEIGFELLNDDDGIIKYQKTEKGGFITHEWTGENIAPIKRYGDSPNLRYYAPHVNVYVKSYQTKNGTVNLLRNLDDLYAWYQTFTSHLQSTQSQDLKNVVEELKKVSADEKDLVARIYHWVQENIKYIAFEDGMRGLIPHQGDYIFEKRYGDCKDMANLIVTMCEAAGVKAYHTWIGTRDIPYNYTDWPSPLVDNHMIATYIDADSNYYFLDATGRFTSFGYPSSMIQGKQALVGLDNGKYIVKRVPEISELSNYQIDTVKISLNENKLQGKGSALLYGYPKVYSGYSLDRSKEKAVKDYMVKLLSRGSNKFFLEDFAIKDLLDVNLPTTIDFQFRIEDYFQRIGDETYINLNLNKNFYNDFIDLNIRKVPIQFDYKYTLVEVYQLELPKNHVVDYIPENFKFENDLMSFQITYSRENESINYKKELLIKTLEVPVSQFSDWNKAIEALSKNYRETIVLKTNK